jgi:hypothetical protein
MRLHQKLLNARGSESDDLLVLELPPTILAKGHEQALLPPMLQDRVEFANTRKALLATQYYLNHFPRGPGQARKISEQTETERLFTRLKNLMACETLTRPEAELTRDTLNSLHKFETDLE